MKLFYKPGACSLAAHISAQEAGVKVELVKVVNCKLEDGTDFKTINPKGYTPSLMLDNGTLLTEGPAICQYLADQNPGARLAPAANSLERYQLTSWQVFIGTEMHKQFGPLFRGGTDEAKKAAIDMITGRLQIINEELKSKPYLMGENFSVADAYLFTILTWCPKVGIDLAQFPAVTEFKKRVADRPKVKEVLEAEAAVMAAAK